MVCIQKEKYRAELEEYSRIFGGGQKGEDIAYTLLCLNNGYTLDKTPKGEDSILYRQLLEVYNNDDAAAIKSKAEYYSKEYLDEYGDWLDINIEEQQVVTTALDVNGEPSFSMLSRKDKIVKTKNYTFQYGQINQEYKSSLDSHVKARVTSKIANNPAITDNEILDEENKAAIEFLSQEQTSVMQETQLKLAEAFGLKKQKDGSWATNDNSEVGKLRVEFVNSLGDHAGEYDMALHTIKIGMDQGDPTTFNHELAHFYVRKFWNSSLVQQALDLVSKQGMTDEEREEALVESITEMTTDNMFNSSLETRNGFFAFWEKFANLLYRVFNVKTKSARNNIIQSLTKSFVINEQLNNVNSRNHIFTMYEGVVQQKKAGKSNNTKTIYKARFKNVSHDVAIQNIMNFIQSRESSAKRNPSSSKEELHRLQNMVYKAKSTAERITEAITAKDASTELHEKAKYLIDFMQDAVDEMRQYINMLRSSEANGYRMAMFDIDPDSGAQVFNRNGAQSQVLSDHQLINMKTDVIDFFTDTFRAIGNVIQDARLVQTFDSQDFAELQRIYDNSNIVRMSQELSTVFNKIVEKRSYENVDQLIDNETNLSDDEKFRLKISMRKWLTDAMDFGDISALEVWAGLGSQSKSPVIRALQYMIDKTAFVSDNIVKEKGDELQEKLRKARNSLPIVQRAAYKILPINIQKVFLEKHNGLPTGNFIQRINQGHYDQNREDYSNKLLYGKGGIVEKMRKMKDSSGNLLFPRDPNTGEKFDLDFDKYGNPIFPDIPEAYDIEKQYLYKMEEFYAKNADRPYMPIYYKTRLDMLSVPTLHALRRFDDKIGELKAMCTVAGYPHYDLLTASQQDELKHLEAQKYNLGEFYELDGTLKPEDSDEYKIAKELYEFHEEVRKHVQYTVDQEAFDEALNASSNKASFIENNTKWIINPRHTEYYNSLIPSYEQRLGSNHPLIKKYKELRRKRDQLVSHIKKPGFEYPDISMLWDEDKVELKFPQFWKNLKLLDQEIAVTKARLKKIAPKVNKDDAKEAKNMFKTPYVPVNPDDNVFDARTLSWFKKITNDIEHSSLSYDDKIILLNKLSIRGAGSNPLSIFTLWMPYKGVMRNGIKYGKDRTGEYPMFIQVPLSHFSKIDTQNSDSEWVNTQFKSENGRSYVPKESIYKNKTYETYVENGTQEMKDLYNTLVDTMKESWAKIPFLRDYDYRLPQMRANTLAVLGRRRNIFKSIGNIFAYWFNITEMDTEYNDDFETVPDGRGGVRRREFVPVRFIKRLNSPEYITSDLVGSVTMFYKMATDFQVKSQYAPSFQMFLEQLKNSNEERSVKKVTHMINTQLYDREENIDFTKDQSSNSTWAKRGIKFLKNTRAATQLGLLAFNLTSGIVSFLDPFLSMVADVITGKYTNAWDNAKALGILAWNFPGAVASLGRVNAYNKVPAAMQRFMLQKGPISTYRNTYMSQVRRFLSDGLSMKVFSVGDYTMNAITMVSTMQNYRLYDDGNTKKWYHKKEFINKAVQDGKTEQEAKQMYRKAHILWNAYEISHKKTFIKKAIEDGKTEQEAEQMWNASGKRDGQFEPKYDEVGKTITPEIEFNVRQQVRARVSIYNGIVDENEKTLLQTNVWLRFLTMLRNFFITGMWERFKNLRDFQIPLYEGNQQDWVDREGNILIQNPSTEEIRNAKRMQNVYKGGYNFNTRQIEDGIFTGVNNVVANIIPYIRYMLFIMNPTRWGASKKDIRRQKREEGFSNSRGRVVTISDQDLYDIDKVLTELGLIGLVLFAQVLMANKINGDDDPPFAMLSTYGILVRLIQERATWYNPATFFDIITTITTSWSDIERKFKAVEYLWDILGITGHDPSDIVKRGIYKGHTRAFRDLMMLTSSLGTHNLLSSITEEGVASKVRFYESILPWWAKIVQPEKASKRKKSKKGGSYYQI